MLAIFVKVKTTIKTLLNRTCRQEKAFCEVAHNLPDLNKRVCQAHIRLDREISVTNYCNPIPRLSSGAF